jgi:aryl-alcohol dehydrogenase-like predicted oxidoreductase
MGREGNPTTPDDVQHGLEESLKRLGTDCVEIYHLHGVLAEQYEYAHEQLVPALLKLREQGKIRFLGVTEAFARDTAHHMMSRAVLDDCWDVVMVGFNILNQSARERVFVHTRSKDIGVLNMFAVRDALSQPAKLQQAFAELVRQGAVEPDEVDLNEPLAFLTRDGAAHSLPDAAYRFCREEPGIHVVLSGTGNVRHLEENVASILRPPLPPEVRRRLIQMFAGVDTVSGQ